MATATIDLTGMTYTELGERAAAYTESIECSGYRTNRGWAGRNIYRDELDRRIAAYGYDGVMAQTFAEMDAAIVAGMTDRELAVAIIANPDATVDRAELARRRQAVGAQLMEMVAA